jgi:hypothetical protein
MDLVQQIAIGAGLAWASGIRLYAVLFLAGVLAQFGFIQLPSALQVLTHPLVMGVSGCLFVVEFFADKVPGLDSAWDAIHTFIRIPAGAVLAAATFSDVDPALMLAAGLVGGTIASGSHLAKASSRAAINTSPEPFSNWAASFTEEAAVLGGLWAMFLPPVAFLVLLVLFLGLVIWLLPKFFRTARALVRRVSGRVPAPRPD